MSGKKWLIRIGSYLVGLVVVSIGLVVITNISSGRSGTRDVSSVGVRFTSGDISGVPVYPNAVQYTDSVGVVVPDDMRLAIGTRKDQWKRYLTIDKPDEVLSWYGQAMEEAGFQPGDPRESGVVLFPQGDTRYALYVTVTDGLTNIILAEGKE